MIKWFVNTVCGNKTNDKRSRSQTVGIWIIWNRQNCFWNRQFHWSLLYLTHWVVIKSFTLKNSVFYPGVACSLHFLFGLPSCSRPQIKTLVYYIALSRSQVTEAILSDLNYTPRTASNTLRFRKSTTNLSSSALSQYGGLSVENKNENALPFFFENSPSEATTTQLPDFTCNDIEKSDCEQFALTDASQFNVSFLQPCNSIGHTDAKLSPRARACSFDRVILSPLVRGSSLNSDISDVMFLPDAPASLDPHQLSSPVQFDTSAENIGPEILSDLATESFVPPISFEPDTPISLPHALTESAWQSENQSHSCSCACLARRPRSNLVDQHENKRPKLQQLIFDSPPKTTLRRKTKWLVEPAFSQMLHAVVQVRFREMSSEVIARQTGIPSRTIRRYVAISKDPKRAQDSPFYMKCDPDQDASVQNRSSMAIVSPSHQSVETCDPMDTIFDDFLDVFGDDISH